MKFFPKIPFETVERQSQERFVKVTYLNGHKLTRKVSKNEIFLMRFRLLEVKKRHVKIVRYFCYNYKII